MFYFMGSKMENFNEQYANMRNIPVDINFETVFLFDNIFSS